MEHNQNKGVKMETNLETQKRPNTFGAFLVGAVAGATAGAIALLLTAPQPGEKTREELKKGVTKFKDQTTDTVKGKVEQVKTRASQIKTDVTIKADQLQHQGRGMIVKQLDRVSKLAESGKKAIQEPEEHVVV